MPNLGTFRGKAREESERDMITNQCFYSKATAAALKQFEPSWLYDRKHMAWYIVPHDRGLGEEVRLCCWVR